MWIGWWWLGSIGLVAAWCLLGEAERSIRARVSQRYVHERVELSEAEIDRLWAAMNEDQS